MHQRHIHNKINKSIRELNADMEKTWDQVGQVDCFMTFVAKMKMLAEKIESEEDVKDSLAVH